MRALLSAVYQPTVISLLSHLSNADVVHKKTHIRKHTMETETKTEFLYVYVGADHVNYSK